jgi:hypothetical protein
MFIDSCSIFAHAMTGLVKSLPKRMPFVTFRQEADAGRRLIEHMMSQPLEHVKEEIVR